jgi:indole-3-glycerol phosphate synthase
MIQAVPDILARIVDSKRAELAASASARAGLERRAADSIGARRDFRAALAAQPPAIVAEIKKASPSKGLLSADFDPSRLASEYREGGAAALSVLTDAVFFQGSFHHLEAARSASGLPVLRKDFTIDEFHVVEAAAYGADAILLIAAILSERQLRRFRELASELGMAALVEVHDRGELRTALDSGAAIVGVNNRNLHTFEVALETSMELAGAIPGEILKVSESGIHGRADVAKLMEAGYSAFLVGEHLMKSGDAAQAVRDLRRSQER